MKRKVNLVGFAFVLLLTGCLIFGKETANKSKTASDVKDTVNSLIKDTKDSADKSSDVTSDQNDMSEDDKANVLTDIPDYDGVHDVVELAFDPYTFSQAERSGTISSTSFGDLDSLGRCTGAVSTISKSTMPTEKRGEIGMVKPTGWVQAKYDPDKTGSDSPYLYNRCHLIAFELSGENANEKNLITGTRQMNMNMLTYENKVADYVRETGHKVRYRVTPVFKNNNLLATAVRIDAYSLEDKTIAFSVLVFNVENSVTIDYATGRSTGPVYE